MAKYPSLKERRVLITGGASGIGLATARRFIREGSRVFILDKNPESLRSALEENPDVAAGLAVDVGDSNQLESAFLTLVEQFGGVDVLIANAGISVRKPFLKIEPDQWRRVMNTNLDGAFLCSRLAVREMRKQRSGVILFTASTNGIEGHPWYTDYNVSKAGVILLAKTLALEFAPWLRVNAVCPGYVLTPMQKAEYTPEMLEEVNAGIPMRRHADPEEVAALFAFLSSDEASYITGQAIPIDGGETTGPGLKPGEESG